MFIIIYLYEFLYISCVLSIWFSVILSMVYLIGGVLYIIKEHYETIDLYKYDDKLPTVTIMVPAHNEDIVITNTVEKIFKLNYPKDLVQLIVINDNSSDNTGSKLEKVKNIYSDRNFKILTIDRTNGGGKGKSVALNNALKYAQNEWICIFDADAAPEKNTLRLLILKTFEDTRYAAVCGRNKARNRNRNLLTKFINLELITSQRIIHTGRWFLFKMGQIPGTNFIIKKSLLLELGGWDEKALTEDTDLAFSIIKKGFLISLESRAEAYEQEPETLKVYINQRVRWSKGNYYVVLKNFKTLFKKNSWRIKLDIIYYFLTYYFFLSTVIISNLFFILWIVSVSINLFFYDLIPIDIITLNINFNMMFSFLLMLSIYIIQINIALASDLGQSTLENFILSFLSYFTYSHLWTFICIKSIVSFLKDIIFKRETTWHKTERF